MDKRYLIAGIVESVITAVLIIHIFYVSQGKGELWARTCVQDMKSGKTDKKTAYKRETYFFTGIAVMMAFAALAMFTSYAAAGILFWCALAGVIIFMVADGIKYGKKK